jgi:hypothetical protein
MRDFLQQIGLALQANLYYVGLFAVLAIPDMCGAAASKDGRSTREKYIAWFDKYVGGKCQFLTGDDCYRFRCSALHQGSSQHASSSYSRVIFVEPSASTNIFHCNVLNDALNIDVRIFCEDMTNGALQWLSEVEGTEPFETNKTKFMTRYSSGLPPYIVGVPVIS